MLVGKSTSRPLIIKERELLLCRALHIPQQRLKNLLSLLRLLPQHQNLLHAITPPTSHYLLTTDDAGRTVVIGFACR
jgi:hypothetical protein